MKINNYWESMEKAESPEVQELLSGLLDKLLKKSQLEYINFEHIPMTEKSIQYNGYDKLIYRENKPPLVLEEKIRYKDWNDFLIEVVADLNCGYYDPSSNTVKDTQKGPKFERAHGWAFKDYHSNLFFYYIREEVDQIDGNGQKYKFLKYHKGFLFSWKKLQKIILENLPQWYLNAEKNVTGFRIKDVSNKDYIYNYSYKTRNISVPWSVILKLYVKEGGKVLMLQENLNRRLD